MKRIVAILILVLTSYGSQGQYSVSTYGSFMHFLGGSGLKHPGFGVKAEYEINEWTGLYLGFDYFLKGDYTAFAEAQAWSGLTYVEIPSPSSVSFMHFHIGTRIYFYGELDPVMKEGFSAYAIGGGGLLMGDAKSFVDPTGYDAYEVRETGNVERTFVNYNVNFGVGAEKVIGSIRLFIDALGIWRVNQANSYSVKTKIPFGLRYDLGVRIPITTY